MNQTNQLKRTMTRLLLAFMLILTGYAGVFAQQLSIDFKQAANKRPTAGKIEWINGNLNANNSFYYEGMAVPQRIILDNLKAGVIKSDPYEPSFNTLINMFLCFLN